MKLIYIYIICALFTFCACNKFNCDKNSDIRSTVKYIGADKISKIELYPNGPQLIADGHSELKFLVKCYYKIKDTIDVPMLIDRIPFDKIIIKSSDNKEFKVNQVYSTESTRDSVFFTCSLGKLKSEKVGIKLTKPEDLNYTQVKIPLMFHCLYSNETENSTLGITKEFMQSIIDRVNKVFNNQLENSPSGASANITFVLAGIDKMLVPDENFNSYSLSKYIKEELLKDEDYNSYVNIWISPYVPYRLAPSDANPKYTLGNPDDLPGLNLKKVSDVSEVKDVQPSDIGMMFRYSDLYNMPSRKTSDPVETSFGYFYGLLDTGTYEDKTGDIDYCPDTYSYELKELDIQKHTLPLSEKSRRIYYYNSYNIMDKYSSCTSISHDQVKRIRQVLKDCPFRQQRVK